MTDTDVAYRMRIFLVRGLKKRTHAVDTLTKKIAIPVICDTWADGDGDPITNMLNGSTAAPKLKHLR